MKNQFFQIIRGICIISVVLIHTLSQDTSITFNNELNIIIRTFVNFSVGVFIFMSGYFVKADEVRNGSFSFVKRKIKRLIIPYLIWTIIYTILFHIDFIKKFDVKNLIRVLLLGNSAAHMYYIIALIQLIIITPMLVIIMDKKSNLTNILIGSISLIYTTINGAFNMLLNKSIPLYATLFLAWLTFYYLGILVRNNRLKKDKLTIKTELIAISIILVINSIINLLEYKNGFSYGYCATQIKLSNSIYIISVILLIATLLKQNNTDKIKPNLLSKVGDYSFGIYLSHMVFIIIFNKLFSSIRIIPIGKSILITSLSILASMVCIYLFNKITKNKLKKYLGF